SPSSGALAATPTSSSATVTLSVAANTSLAQGVYSSQAVITFQSSSIPQIVIPVSLTVQPPAAAIVASPSSVSFSYQFGAPQGPAAQSIAISNPAASSLTYTLATISDSWIAVSPSVGSTPGNISVT